MSISGNVEGDKELARQLKALSKESERTVKDALARAAFAGRAQVERDLSQQLSYSGPSTQKFIAGGYRVRYQTLDGVFEALIYPLDRTARLLVKHVQRWVNRPKTDDDVVFQGKIAVPIAVERNARGRVPVGQLPEALVKRGAKGRSRGFLTKSGLAVMRRIKGARPVVAWVLRSQTVNPKRIDPVESVKRGITGGIASAVKAAIQKTLDKAGRA